MPLKVDAVVVTDKKHMAKLFNHHFIKSGFLFDSAMPPCRPTFPHLPPFYCDYPDASPSFSPAPLQSFSLQAVTESLKVLKEFLKHDHTKIIWVRWFRPFLL
jgi:hypothetical protein